LTSVSKNPSAGGAFNVLIAGGGIGGLTTALALHARGHRVRLCEASAQVQPLGVGINVLPHAVAVLSALGLKDALKANGVATAALLFANKHGQTIYRDARGTAGGYGEPQYSIHRGSLHTLLWQAALAALGVDALITGARLVSFSQSGTGVQAAFSAPDGSGFTLDADVLVAADGIASAARAQLYPDEGAPKWNGTVMWRGTTRAKPFLDGRTMVQAGHSRAKFVVYPITDTPDAQGKVLINWIADLRVRNDGAGSTLTAPKRADWSRAGTSADLLPTFGSWQFDWLDVPGLIEGAAEIYEWPMVDRDPLPRWSHGCVTLLGDAAHPMAPIGSNGATQAILDAAALADALDSGVSAQAALAAYDAERRPPTSRIVQLNRSEGLDSILDLVEIAAPGGFTQLGDAVDPAHIHRLVQQYKAAAGHVLTASA
jgi:5-methylphenazine-1-carboxylate 1-monooxygenase